MSCFLFPVGTQKVSTSDSQKEPGGATDVMGLWMLREIQIHSMVLYKPRVLFCPIFPCVLHLAVISIHLTSASESRVEALAYTGHTPHFSL